MTRPGFVFSHWKPAADMVNITKNRGETLTKKEKRDKIYVKVINAAPVMSA
jgi:hypothetical protein